MIEPLLPPAGRARGRWRDHRQVLEGIVFKFHTGVPEGSAGAVRTLADRARTLRPLGRRRNLQPHPGCGPGTSGGRLAGRPGLHDRPGPSAHRSKRGLEERGLGRSRGGLTSKIHLACDGRGRPLSFTVTAGTRNDCTQAATVIDAIRVIQPGPGRPRVRPERVVADKGYSARTFRAYLRRRGIKATIPERVDQLAGRRRRRERPCGASTASSSGAASPPATRNSPDATSQPSPWPAHSSGSRRDRQDAA